MNSHERREQRNAKALRIIKAMRRDDRNPPLLHTELAGDDLSAPGLVYFVYCAGRLKIGYTTDIKERMASFATHCPLPATLLLTIKGYPADEALYHEMFDGDRARGEWFDLSFGLREFLQDKFKSGTFELMSNAEYDAREIFLAAESYYPQFDEQWVDANLLSMS